MAEYQVVCATQEPCRRDANIVHVTAVCTGEPAHCALLWTTMEVSRAISHGDRFYIQSRDIRQTAEVRCVLCPGCLEVHTLDSGSTLASLDIHKLPPVE